jgi:dihydrofolate reductase
MLSIVVAVSENNVIGKDNKLLWHIPEDMKKFKELTTGKTIIMGRKTFESLGKVLPERKHVVLSRDPSEELLLNDQITIAEDVSKLNEYINSEEESFVIGGAIVYRLLMPYCTKNVHNKNS